jgi:hypothetical protein
MRQLIRKTIVDVNAGIVSRKQSNDNNEESVFADEYERTRELLCAYELLSSNVDLLLDDDFEIGISLLVKVSKENLTNPLSASLRYDRMRGWKTILLY